MPLIHGESVKNRYRVHAIIMKVSRWRLKSFCFKTSIQDICDMKGWETHRQMLLKSSAKFIIQAIHQQKPEKIVKIYQSPRTRLGAKVTTTYNPKTQTYRSCTTYRLIQLYSQLPTYTKNSNQKDLAKILKKINMNFNETMQ